MGQIKAHSPPTSLNSTRGLGKLGVSANTPLKTHPSYLSNKHAPKQQQQVRLAAMMTAPCKRAYVVFAFFTFFLQQGDAPIVQDGTISVLGVCSSASHTRAEACV